MDKLVLTSPETGTHLWRNHNETEWRVQLVVNPHGDEAVFRFTDYIEAYKLYTRLKLAAPSFIAEVRETNPTN